LQAVTAVKTRYEAERSHAKVHSGLRAAQEAETQQTVDPDTCHPETERPVVLVGLGMKQLVREHMNSVLGTAAELVASEEKQL
jgi:hypothetical protein